MFRGFWDTLPHPIIGLSPMDGVTDAPFRYIVNKYGKPHVTITEFTNVEGLSRGATSMLMAFDYDETERPIVGQIYGVEVDSFYKVTLMLCELGFDGIDVNMGCPANKVARRGSGAELIRTPDLAKAIMRTCQKAAKDWSEGQTLEGAGLRPKVVTAVNERKKFEPTRRLLPVSVKTRIGFDGPITEEWIKHLLETKPANISLHGRTLKQMYLGEANWEEIGKAAAVVKQSGLKTTLLGNGDIKTLEDAHERIKHYGVDGVLVGRATFGNPWFFKGYSPTTQDRAQVAVEHSKAFEQIHPHLSFMSMRKHLGWYCREFDGARETRVKLMQSNSSDDVKTIFSEAGFF